MSTSSRLQHTPAPSLERHRDALKWLGLATMLIDHLGKTVWIEQLEWTHLMGRFAWPAFLWLLVVRLAERPDRAPRYLAWLVPWGIVATLPWRVIAGDPRGCVLLSFAVGVGIDALRTRLQRPVLAAALGLLIAFTVGHWVEFGPYGVLAIPLATGLLRQGRRVLAVTAAMICVGLANAVGGPSSVAVSAIAMAALPWLVPVLPGVPRTPRASWYAVYAGHLWLLWAWMWLTLDYPAHYLWEIWRTPP